VDAESLPAGVSVTLEEATPAVVLADGQVVVTPAARVNLVVAVSRDATPGRYALALIGEGGGRWHSANLPLTVYEPRVVHMPAVRK
jgi:hypothetical protein